MMGISAYDPRPANDFEQTGRAVQLLLKRDREDREWEMRQRQQLEDSWAQQDADRASDRGWDEEKRAWQRSAWKRAQDMMNKLGVGDTPKTGGSFGVSGL
jgi:hypothetical protein